MKNNYEKWRDIYTLEELKTVQKIEKENLLTLLDVCEKLNVQPIMYGGSLIGTIRHKGFIPWDDDIDVAMTRNDYEKFIKEAPGFLPKGYQLQTPYIEKSSPYPYAKLRRKNTICIEYVHHKLNISKGVYIDIYPIDNIPDDDDEYELQHKTVQKFIRLFVRRQAPFSFKPVKSVSGFVKLMMKKVFSLVLHIIPLKIFLYCINSELERYNSQTTKRQCVVNYPKKENWYSKLYPLVDAEFEGIKVKIPNDWHEHLTRRYGDYMVMPPENQRVGHKPYLLDVKAFM